jgi:filamentous hemagglutinin family protein
VKSDDRRRRRTGLPAWIGWAVAAALIGGGASATVLPQGPAVVGSTSGPGATFSYSGPSTLTINQSASRVVIDWNSFSIGAGGTVNFVQTSPGWIAFNRVNINPRTGLSPLSTLSGALTATGGVWLFSTGGILIGSTAVVNVGSFAAITGPLNAEGGIAQLLNPDSSGLTIVSLSAPIGAGVEKLTVENGAQISAVSGFVVLQGETMVQDGAVTASDGVDYLVSESGQITFATVGPGQQLQSADAIVVAGQDRPSLTLGGVTTAGWVGIDTPGGALQSGYHTVINLDGVIDATGVKPGSGGDGVVFLVGGALGPAYPGYTNSSIGIDASAATIEAANGLSISTNSATLGRIDVGGALSVDTYGDIAATAPITAGGAALFDSTAGAVAFNANVTADGSIFAGGAAVTVGAGAILHSDALGEGLGGIDIMSIGGVAAAPSSSLVAGSSAAEPADPVTIRAGSGPGGGDIVAGAIAGNRVFIQSQSQGNAGEGAITLAGKIEGPEGVTVLINDVTAAGEPAGDLQIQGAVASQGVVDIENLGPGALDVGTGASLTSSGSQVFLYSGGETTVATGARVAGASILDHTLGTLTVASGASLATTASTPAPIAPVIPYGSDFQRATGLNLAAGSMVIQGSVTAGTASAPDDIYIEVLGPAGATAVIGGAGGGPGFDLSNASFSNLSARDVIIMGGPGEATAPGDNLLIQDLTLNSAKISSLWLGTASSQTITVSGSVAATGAAPVDVQVGFVRLGAGGSYSGGPVVDSGEGGLDGFIPGEIDITGALGSPTAPLGAVTLIARNNIFMGDSAFVAAAQANPDFDAATSSGDYPGYTPGQAFVAAQTLQLAAQGRIVQQNTAGDGVLFGGLDIGEPTPSEPLIFVPAALQGQSIADNAWTADYAAGPTLVAVSGALLVPGGSSLNGTQAAGDPGLVSSEIGDRTVYEINSCAFGDSCASPTGALTFEPPELVSLAAADEGTISTVVAAIVANASNPDIFTAFTATPPTLQADTDRLGIANPITEIGNGDLWTGESGDCPSGATRAQDCVRP